MVNVWRRVGREVVYGNVKGWDRERGGKGKGRERKGKEGGYKRGNGFLVVVVVVFRLLLIDRGMDGFHGEEKEMGRERGFREEERD